MLPLKIQLLSLRVTVHAEIITKEKTSLRLGELDILDEDRLIAQQNPKLYRHQMSRAFNKQVRLQSFQKGDLILAILTPMIIGKKKGKLEPNCEAPL